VPTISTQFINNATINKINHLAYPLHLIDNQTVKKVKIKGILLSQNEML